MSVPKNRKHSDPLKTRTGKTRLGPLSLTKLQEMLDKARPKDKTKIQNRINAVKKIGKSKDGATQASPV